MYMLWMLKCNAVNGNPACPPSQGPTLAFLTMISRRLDQLVVKTPALHCNLSKYRHCYSLPI